MRLVFERRSCIRGDVLDERWSRATPRVSEVDDQWYPTVVNGDLWVEWVSRGKGISRQTSAYASDVDSLGDAFLWIL